MRRAAHLMLSAMVLAASLLVGCGHAVGEDTTPEVSGTERFDHAAFDAILRRRVKDGVVDYVGLAKDDRAALRGYLAALAKADPRTFVDDDERKAFWINAYNATVLESVLTHWPVRDVTNVAGFFGRERHRIAGEERTLNDIEKKVLRPQFGDERTHFALVCAARGCPKLESTAYVGKGLEARLEAAARAFVRDLAKVRVDAEKIHASSIFDWYGGEFEAKAGTIVAYLAKYADDATAKRLRAKKEWSFSYAYDWTINARRAFR